MVLLIEAQIQLFHLLPRPRSFAQEFEAGGYARVVGETTDRDPVSHFRPPELINEPSKHRLEGEAMERIGRGHDEL